MSFEEDLEVEPLCDSLDLEEDRCSLLAHWVKQEFKALRYQMQKSCDAQLSQMEKEKEKSKSKTKRKPSDYNKWVGKCMKEADIKKFSEAADMMKKCAVEWKENKEEIKEMLRREGK